MATMRLLTAVLLGSILAMAGGCGDSDEPPPVAINTDTPRATIESFHAAWSVKNLRAISGLVPPTLSEPVGAMMGALQDIGKAAESLADTTESKLGKEQADVVRRNIPFNINNSPLSGAIGQDGQLDWSSIRIEEQGDRATVYIKDRPQSDLAMVRIDGKWYMDIAEGEDQAEFLEGVEQATSMGAKLVPALEAFEKRVSDGEVPAEAFQMEFYRAISGAN